MEPETVTVVLQKKKIAGSVESIYGFQRGEA